MGAFNVNGLTIANQMSADSTKLGMKRQLRSVKRVSNGGSVTPGFQKSEVGNRCQIDAVSKGFGSLAFRGSTMEKRPVAIFRFGYGKAVNDKKVPDRVGSVDSSITIP
jgi:hypothetical protein